MLRRLLFLLPVFALLFLSSAGERIIYRNNSQNIQVRPLPLNPGKPEQKKIGALEFLGAWELRSDNQDFGGISGLTIQEDGRFLAVSDAGTLVGFGLTGKNEIDRPFIAPMPDAFAKGRNYADRDSESILRDPASGNYWVSYEGKHAIRRFGPAFTRTTAIGRPKAMQQWGVNSGAEAITRLPDGRFVIFSEGQDLPDGAYEALLFSGDPTEKGSSSFAFGYKPPKGHKITDAKLLPGGHILTLNRQFGFGGLSAALAIFDPKDIGKGKTITPKVIARLEAPLLVDNMEGLAIGGDNGQPIIWIISDDNFNMWQRTILMKFALRETESKKPVDTDVPGFDAL